MAYAPTRERTDAELCGADWDELLELFTTHRNPPEQTMPDTQYRLGFTDADLIKRTVCDALSRGVKLAPVFGTTEGVAESAAERMAADLIKAFAAVDAAMADPASASRSTAP